jgi:hypothetical protein
MKVLRWINALIIRVYVWSTLLLRMEKNGRCRGYIFSYFIKQVIATALNDPVSYPINKDPKEFVFKYTGMLSNLTPPHLGVTYNNEIQKTNLSLSCEGDVQTPTYEKYESNILHITWKTKEVCSVSEDAGNSTVSLFLSFVGWMFYGFAAVMIGFTVYNFAILREPFPNAIPLLHVWTGIWYAIQDSAYWVSISSSNSIKVYEKVVGNQYVRL